MTDAKNSPIGQADVEMLKHLADSVGFGRTHDMLRRVIAATPYLTQAIAATQTETGPVTVNEWEDAAASERTDLLKANQILHGLLSNREAEIERMKAAATPAVGGEREALEAARQEIVLAIAFIGRDNRTDRLPKTLDDLVARLVKVDQEILAALGQPASPLRVREITDAIAWRWRHVNSPCRDWNYQNHPIGNHNEYLEVEPLYLATTLGVDDVQIAMAMYDWQYGAGAWESSQSSVKNHFIGLARAALAALPPPLRGRESLLAKAAQDFIDKVDRGEARSKNSYAAFKAALAAPPEQPAADPVTGRDEIEFLRDALGEIASKNDLSGVSDGDLASAACNALHECELIARNALSASPPEQPAADPVTGPSPGYRLIEEPCEHPHCEFPSCGCEIPTSPELPKARPMGQS